MAALFGLLDFALRASIVLPLLTFFFNLSPVRWERDALYWISAFTITDLAYYFVHWTDHKVRMFWAVHVNHHSSLEFNITTGFRSPVFQPLYRAIYFIPGALMGFEPLDILLVYAVAQIYGTLIHTQHFKSWGWLDWIFVTPAHHRVHHGSNEIYLDKNMGMFFIVWDRIFGTFQKELPDLKIRYGITEDVSDRRIVNLVFHEWINIKNDILNEAQTTQQRFQYLLKPPGWRPQPPKINS